MEKGGLDGVFLAVFVGQGPLDEPGYRRAYDQAMVKFDALERLTERMYPNRTELARTPADVERIAKSGKRILMIGMENGYPMGTDLANLRRFYDLGARYLTLTHRDHNQIADSSSVPAPIHGGLSPLGRRVVAELNRLGMMVDVSHISEQSFWDVIAITKAPIVASHSACASLTDSDRNLTDDQLRALARNGGGGVPGFSNVAEASNVTIELVRRGYTEAQIRKIWGENLLRVWRDVEKAAAGLGEAK